MLFELESVDFDYPEGVPGLRDVSFTIEPGERIAILGANGSGKSTLLRLLDGVVFPTRGRCRFMGEDLTEKSLQQPVFQYQFRSAVGFVFQNPEAQLFNASVWEEAAFGPRQLGLAEQEVEARVTDVLSFLGISHLADRAPFRLSGGEKRRVALASVLSMNPQVVLLDEPFAGLDPKMGAGLLSTLQQLHQAAKTTVVTTHDLSLLPKIADRALLISEDHELIGSYRVGDLLGDKRLLLDANLIAAEEAFTQ